MNDTTRDRRRTVLIVDDTSNNISLLNEVLMDEYGVKVAKSGGKAIEIARSMPVDLILLDVMMPEMDGFETCRRLKLDPLTRRIPVIFVTARGEVEDESMGFSCGGVDYITKPIRPTIVRARVRTHLALYDQNLALDEMVRQRTAELRETRMEILNRLGRAAEYRDNETGMHVVRMSRYARIIAFEYGLPADEAELLFSVAPMHDVGKIGIPDRVLLKPGKLDEEEWRIMQGHCDIGRRIIGHHSSELLQAAATLAHTHHEKWDGSGYPLGLRGTDIPLFSRIVALVDVFDALTSERPYKKAWPVAEAVAEIERCAGRHFDPDVVRAFLRQVPEMVSIKEEFADAPFWGEDAYLPGTLPMPAATEGFPSGIFGRFNRAIQGDAL
ncbi:MAG TPA: two-component system response regulator [Desulfuromonadaceae bacterium]